MLNKSSQSKYKLMTVVPYRYSKSKVAQNYPKLAIKLPKIARLVVSLQKLRFDKFRFYRFSSLTSIFSRISIDVILIKFLLKLLLSFRVLTRDRKLYYMAIKCGCGSMTVFCIFNYLGSSRLI